MIKIIKKLLFMLGLFISPVIVGFNGALPGGPGAAMFDMPSPEEMQAIEEFLNTLSPEEIDQLAQLGEQIIKEAEAEGRPLFEGMPVPTPVVEKPLEVKKEAPVTNSTEKAKDDTKKKDQKILKNIIISLIDILSDLRQKAATDEHYSKILHSVNADLDNFVYYLHVIKDSKHLANITEEEFTKLKNEVLNLELELGDRVENLVIPSILTPNNMTRSEREARRKSIRKAEQVLNECEELLKKAFTETLVLKDCEALLKKYEPHAIKIKDEQTKKSQIAGGQATRLPVTNTGKIVQGQTYSTKTAHYSPVSRGRSVGTTVASSYKDDKQFGGNNMPHHSNKSSNKSGSNPGAKKSSGAPDSEKGSDGKAMSPDESIKTRAKIKEKQNEMVEKLKAANKEILNKQSILNEFLHKYVRSEAKNPELEKTIHDTFDTINYELKQAQKAYNECTSKSESLGNIQNKKIREECKKNTEIYIKPINDFTEKLAQLYEQDVIEEKLDEFDPKIEELEKYLQKLPSSEKPLSKVRKKSKKSDKPQKQKPAEPQQVVQKPIVLPQPPELPALNIPTGPSLDQSLFERETDDAGDYNEPEILQPQGAIEVM